MRFLKLPSFFPVSKTCARVYKGFSLRKKQPLLPAFASWGTWWVCRPPPKTTSPWKMMVFSSIRGFPAPHVATLVVTAAQGRQVPRVLPSHPSCRINLYSGRGVFFLTTGAVADGEVVFPV